MLLCSVHCCCFFYVFTSCNMQKLFVSSIIYKCHLQVPSNTVLLSHQGGLEVQRIPSHWVGAIIVTFVLPMCSEHNRAGSHRSAGCIVNNCGLKRKKKSHIYASISTSSCQMRLDFLDASKGFLEVITPQPASLGGGLRNIFYENRMFLQDSLFPLSCCTPHLISHLTAGLLKYTQM